LQQVYKRKGLKKGKTMKDPTIRRSVCDSIRKVTVDGDTLTDEEILQPEFLEKNVSADALALFVSEFGNLYIDSVKKIERVNRDHQLKIETRRPSNEKIINLLRTRVLS
jgi:esterase/lipase superfamily enzyme